MRDQLIELAHMIFTCVVFLALFVVMLLFGHAVEASNKKPTAIEVETFIREEARRQSFDEDIAVAVAKVESSLNVNAVGGLGEIGLFQLRPEFHQVKRGDYKHNTRVAIKYLVQMKKRCSGVYPGISWVNCYNHGPNRRLKNPIDSKYHQKVLGQYLILKYRAHVYASLAE